MRHKLLIISLLLSLLTIVTYWPVTGNQFIAYDDQLYITDNPYVTSGLSWQGIKWAFTTFDAANWHPLTWLSHMLDVTLFGVNPAAHHVTNLFLHTANTLLLLALLIRLTGALWRSAIVAAFFALHPLHVESVAWAAERKDLLCALFFFLTLHAYIRYAEQSRVHRLFPVTLFFAFALMSKPMAVTVPMLLLLLDWWPLQRFGRVPLQTILLEKAPLFFLSGASCIITLSAQQSGGAVIAVEKLSALERLTNALSSYAIYLWQTLWPQDLALLYPLPPAPPLRTAAFGTVIIILVSTFAFVHRKDRPYLLTGWFWYLGMLLPVIGLVQVGVQSHADRYSYLPMVGCSIAAVWQLHEISANRRLRRALILLTVGTLFMLAFLTRQQTMIWHDSETLFRHAIAITDNNYVMHMNLGIALWERNEQDGAIAEYRKAISICPQYAPQHFILANALLVQGNAEEAADEYRTTLKLHPDYSYAHTNLGMALQKSGHIEEAIAEYEEGIRLLPEDYKAAENLQFLRSKKR